MHFGNAWEQWAVELLQCAVQLPWGSGQWTSCNALPHCLAVVGRGPPAIHCLTARGQWAVDLLHYTASLPRGSGQWSSCNGLSHCLGAVGQLIGQCNSFNALSQCLGAVDSGAAAMRCPTALGQWAVDLL